MKKVNHHIFNGRTFVLNIMTVSHKIAHQARTKNESIFFNVYAFMSYGPFLLGPFS